MLTPEKKLGRDYEASTVNALIAAGVEHHRIKHNPFDDEGYASSVGKGPDIIIDGWFPIECKFTNHTIYPSYVVRCWLPRLKGSECVGVFSCNSPEKVSESSQTLIKREGLVVRTNESLVNHLILIGLITPSSITSHIAYSSNVVDVLSSVKGGLGGVKQVVGEIGAVGLNQKQGYALDATKEDYLARSKSQSSLEDLGLWASSKKLSSYLATFILGGLGFALHPLTVPRHLPTLV